MEKKRKEEKAPRLVPLIGCWGCGLQIIGCGGVQPASPAPPPCPYRDRGAASSFAGTVKAHHPYQVNPLAIEVFDYLEEGKKMKQVKIVGEHCNVFLGQKGKSRPYGCNTLFVSAGNRLTLDELLELPEPKLTIG